MEIMGQTSEAFEAFFEARFEHAEFDALANLFVELFAGDIGPLLSCLVRDVISQELVERS